MENCKYIPSLICFGRIVFSEQYHTKDEAWDVMRNPFQARHINDNMFIDELWKWRQYNNIIMLVSW